MRSHRLACRHDSISTRILSTNYVLAFLYLHECIRAMLLKVEVTQALQTSLQDCERSIWGRRGKNEWGILRIPTREAIECIRSPPLYSSSELLDALDGVFPPTTREKEAMAAGIMALAKGTRYSILLFPIINYICCQNPDDITAEFVGLSGFLHLLI